TYLEVLTGVRAARLLPRRCRVHGLGGAGEQVLQLERLEQVRIPDHGPVRRLHVCKRLPDAVDLGDTYICYAGEGMSLLRQERRRTFIQALLRPKHGGIILHDFLHLQPNIRCRPISICIPQLIQIHNAFSSRIVRQWRMWPTRLKGIPNMMCDGPPKYDDIQQRVRTEPISAMNRHASGLTRSVKAGDGLLLALVVNGEDLARVSGGNAAHVVVNGGQDRDGLLGDVDAREDGGRL
ncbi:hypothetical protein BC938DRAFT_483532, partial [Jimgerdemannia flammicorona]